MFDDLEFCQVYYELFESTKSNVILNILTRIEEYDSLNFNKILNFERIRWGSSCDNLEIQKQNNLDWFETHIIWMDNNI